MPKKVTLTRQGKANAQPVEYEFEHAQRFLCIMHDHSQAKKYKIHSLNGTEYEFSYPDIVRRKPDTGYSDEEE